MIEHRLKLPATNCLLATIAVAPWFRGAVSPAVEQWLAAILVVAYITRLLDDSPKGNSARRVPAAWWAAAAGVVIGFVQLAPLSLNWLDLFSPQAVEWITAANPDDSLPLAAAPPDTVTASLTNRPVTLAPALTRLTLAQLICACAVMLLAVDCCREGRPLGWFLATVTFNGAALAFVALAEKLLRRGILWWDPHKNWLGPFVNRNNGAGYLVMSLGAAFALLLIHFQSGDAGDPNGGTPRSKFSALLRRLDATGLAYLAAVCLMSAAVAASMSRGAVISLVVGTLVAGVAMATAHGWKRIAVGLGLIAVGAIGIPAWIGLLDDIQLRLNTLSDVDSLLQEGRVINWVSGAKAALEFLPLGAGLGAYRYVYRPFETLNATGRFHYPENSFLQTLVEAGIPGTILFLFGLGATTWAAVKLVRLGSGGRRALGITGLFVLSSQSVHACLDNGFYLPANSMLLAALCGVFCGAAANPEVFLQPVARDERSSTWNYLTRAMLPATLVALVWAGLEFRASASAHVAYYELYNFRDEPAVTAEFVDRALVRLEQGLRDRPDDAECRRRAAEFYFARYRRHAIDELRVAYPTANLETLWSLATPATIFAAACRAEQDGDEAAFTALRSQPFVVADLVPAWRHLQLAAAVAPADAETQLYLGELQFLVGKTEHAARHFEFAARLAPARATILLRLGLDELAAGFKPAAYEHLRRSWTLQPTNGDGILAALATRVTWADVVQHVVPESPEIIEELLRKMRQRGASPADIAVLEGRLAEIRGR